MVTDIGTVDGVGDGFLAVVDFLGVRLLAQIEDGAAQAEVAVELMLDAGAEEGLLDGTEARVRFQSNVDGCSRIEDAFVQDGYAAKGVVDGIVNILNQLHTARRDGHRALGHIHGVQADFASRLRRVETLQAELVFLRKLLG